MTREIKNGTRRKRAGVPYIFYDGYWIKYYEPPADSLAAKKKLIEALTRRLFNHVEHGINIPGRRLEEARVAYESETDPALRRVKSAMLAGALFNRAADIFTRLVELQEAGVKIEPENSLMRECGRCLSEALEYGKSVRHRSGDVSIDELWGEPFKAFSVPVEAFYESRYIKIAQTMREIDCIATGLSDSLTGNSLFPGARPLLQKLADAAKRKTETLRTDPAIFDVWPSFVVACESLCWMEARLPPAPTRATMRLAEQGSRLIHDGTSLIAYIARARVPMPPSAESYLRRCEEYRRDCAESAHAA